MRTPSAFRPLLSLAAVASLSLFASSQVNYGGLPPSSYDPLLSGAAPTQLMPEVETWRLIAEDEVAPKNQPARFGEEIPVQLTLGNSGRWDRLANGDRVWRLRIESDGAYSISLIFDDFELPPGAELYAYNDKKDDVYGQFNVANNKNNRMFAIQPLPGDAMTLEYFEPAATVAPGSISISTVVHDYRDVVGMLEEQSMIKPKAAGSCNNDVNCPEGAAWGDQIRSVAAIFIGGGLCTGSMINNTANDGTQYFITANHCGGMNNATFRFNYEKSGCGTGSAPTSMSVQGSSLLKASSNGDYRLVRLTETIPAGYNVYMEGWDRSNTTPSSTVSITHPQVGPKKISFDFNAPAKSGGDWRIIQWDDGVTEPGSSGGPLYSNQGLFIGALYGGAATCGYPYDDYYPRFGNNYSALSQWLNPTGSSAQTLQGRELYGSPPVGCGVTQFGLGAGGANSARLDSPDSPTLGSTVLLQSFGLGGGSTAYLILSLGNPTTPLFGGTLFVNYLTPFALIPLPLTGGVATYNLALPSASGLAYLTGHAQMAAPDTAQAQGWTFSNGLALTFCP